jgi:hypothetical protein
MSTAGIQGKVVGACRTGRLAAVVADIERAGGQAAAKATDVIGRSGVDEILLRPTAEEL